MLLPASFRFKASTSALAALIAVHLLATVVLLAVHLPLWIRLALLFLLAMSLSFAVRKHALRLGSDAIVALVPRKRGELELLYRDGRRAAAGVDESTKVFPWLAALVVRLDGRLIQLPLLADSLGREGFRRMVVWLRHGRD